MLEGKISSSVIRTHVSKETGALTQHLGPLRHTTCPTGLNSSILQLDKKGAKENTHKEHKVPYHIKSK